MIYPGGSDTVTVISYAQTGIDRLGTAVLTPTKTVVPGCRHRPLKTESARGAGMARAQEAAEVGVTIATEWWETTGPPGLMIAKASDFLECNNQTYKVIAGVKPYTNPSTGRVTKVSILSEQQNVGF